MYVIAGLGNPGQKYAETRHNAGFWFIDRLARSAAVTLRLQSRLHSETAKCNLFGHDCLLVKPDTFVNRSGLAVRRVLDFYKLAPDNLLVAYDELDLPAGTVRLKQGGGHGGHNGLRDIFAHLGKPDFLRLRIGIGHPGQKHLVTRYVLSRPDAADCKAVNDAIERALQVLPKVLAGEPDAAMHALHTKDKSPSTAPAPDKD